MDEIALNLLKEIRHTHGLNFKDANTHKLTNGYHPYPASMIPQLPDLFLKALLMKKRPIQVFDPFVGSGTTLVECKSMGINGIGTDFNPLAILIARVKSTALNPKLLLHVVSEVKLYIANHINDHVKSPNFYNVHFWFKPQVIHDLQVIKQAVNTINNLKYRDFLLVAFSYTIRKVSNSRNGEFKLYRMPKSKLASWNPDTIHIFLKILKNNQEQNKTIIHSYGKEKVLFSDSKHLPFKDHSFDALITSPPYGDSRTTVAYGQFSRLELQWIGKFRVNPLFTLTPQYVRSIDRHLLGGNVYRGKLLPTYSNILNQLLFTIALRKPKRSFEVRQFYVDLEQSLREIKRVMKAHSYMFFVTGNRTVAGVTLPTNKIITELFSRMHVKEVGHFTRSISSKRMPSKNSPSNKKKKSRRTMNHEDITIYRI